MSSTTSYQAVPSDEGSSPAKPASRFTFSKVLFLSGLVFLIVAFTSYKAFFSESIQHPSSPQLDSSTKALQTQTSSSIPPAPSDTPEMQGQGKYSVG
jgi:hypothetical protein